MKQTLLVLLAAFALTAGHVASAYAGANRGPAKQAKTKKTTRAKGAKGAARGKSNHRARTSASRSRSIKSFRRSRNEIVLKDIWKGDVRLSGKKQYHVYDVLNSSVLQNVHAPRTRTQISMLLKRAMQRAPTAKRKQLEAMAEGLYPADVLVKESPLKAKFEAAKDGQHRITFSRGDRTVRIRSNYSKKEILQNRYPGFDFRDPSAVD